ncbi:MAG: RNA-binding protein [Pseudomonadota bacterium]
MTRGGRAKERDGPERRCVATGARGSPELMIRFALDPDGIVTPDLAERLPGRGVWVSADAAALDKAVKRNLFARSLKAPARAPASLSDTVARLLAERAIAAIALCRKAGLAVGGFEKARAALLAAAARDDRPPALVQASDASEDGARKLRRLVDGLTVLQPLHSEELGVAFDRPFLMHVALAPGGASDRAVRELRRLHGFRLEGSARAPSAPARVDRDGAGVGDASPTGGDGGSGAPQARRGADDDGEKKGG